MQEYSETEPASRRDHEDVVCKKKPLGDIRARLLILKVAGQNSLRKEPVKRAQSAKVWLTLFRTPVSSGLGGKAIGLGARVRM